jgi:hypothetical protein
MPLVWARSETPEQHGERFTRFLRALRSVGTAEPSLPGTSRHYYRTGRYDGSRHNGDSEL